MTLVGYVSGIIGLTKDVIRFTFRLLKRPHYVAVLIVLILGVFYACGITPREIPHVLNQKWQALVADRKKVFSEEWQSISQKIDKNINPLKGGKPLSFVPQDIELPDIDPVPAPVPSAPAVDTSKQEKERLFEETFGWQKALNSAEDRQPDLPQKDIVQGVLSVLSANKIQIADRTFSLKVRLRSGKAGDAFFQLKRRYDGIEAKCFPDTDNSDLADCFVGALGVSEMLIDFGYADPL